MHRTESAESVLQFYGPGNIDKIHRRVGKSKMTIPSISGLSLRDTITVAPDQSRFLFPPNIMPTNLHMIPLSNCLPSPVPRSDLAELAGLDSMVMDLRQMQYAIYLTYYG